MRFPNFAFPWFKLKIGDICDVQMCKRIFANQTKEVGDVPFYKIGTLGSKADAYISNELFEEYRQKYNYPIIGETLITCSGTIGRCVQFDGKPSYYQDSNIVWLRKRKELILNDFLFRLIQNNDWSKLNTTTISRLYNADLLGLKFFVPSSLLEQEKISSFLALLDSRIETQNKIIEEMHSLKKAIYFNSVKAVALKEVMVSDFCEIGRGRVISQQEIAKQESPKYPVFSSQTLNNGIMGYLDNYDFDGEYVTWTTDGANAGTIFYHNEKFNCTNVCGTLKVKDDAILPYYLYIALSHVAKKYVSKNLGNPKLMNGVMGKITIKIPDALNQEKVVNCLKAFDELIANEARLLECYKNQKQYLLDNMFI